MMKRRFVLSVVSIFLFISTGFTYSAIGRTYPLAKKYPWALSLKLSTLGVGLEGTYQINPNLNIRIGANGFQYDYNGEQSDIKYNIDLELFTAGAILDWFPFHNGLKLSIGAMANENNLELKAKSATSYAIGDNTYTPTQVGTLKGKLNFNDISPYIGIGWGQPFTRERDWSFFLEIGALYQGSPKVDLSANGTLANNSSFQRDLQREEKNIEDDVDEFKFYPVISIGLTYRF